MVPILALLVLLLSQNTVQGQEKVKVGVYYEVRCPDSIRFVNNQLYPVFRDIKSIMKIDLIPYGKASYSKGDNGLWVFTCQHGPRECKGNHIQTCAIDAYPDVEDHLPFIDCMLKQSAPEESGEFCANRMNLDYNAIDACTKSREGNELQHQMGVKTEALSPSMFFVPWITINGKWTQPQQNEALYNLKKTVCDAYKGVKPSKCP